MKRLALILAVTCFITYFLPAQQNNFEYITTRDGLSSYTVLDFAEDEYHRMWVATNEGLNCYDGYQFKIYNTSSDADVNAVSNVVTDRKGHLLCRTSNFAYLLDFRSDTLQRLPYTPVRAVSVADTSFIIATNDSVYVDRNVFASKATSALTCHNDTLWLANQDGVGYRTDSLHIVYPVFNVTRLYFDIHDNLWICTRDSGLYINGDPFPTPLPSSIVRDIVEDRHGQIWIGLFSGLYRYDPSTGAVASYDYDPRAEHSLTTFSVWALHCDYQGTVWIGTYYGGIHLINPGLATYTYYGAYGRESRRLSNPIVNCFAEDRKHNLYIGTNGGGVDYLDRETGTIRHILISREAVQPPVRSLVYDSVRRCLWIGTHRSGIYRMREDISHSLYHIVPSDPDIRRIRLRGDTLYVLSRTRVGYIPLTSSPLAACPLVPDSLLPQINGEFNDMYLTPDSIFFSHGHHLYSHSLQDVSDGIHTRYISDQPRDQDNPAYRHLPLEAIIEHSALTLASGEVVVGGLNGFVILPPSSSDGSLSTPNDTVRTPVLISSVTVNNSLVPASQPIVLRNSDRTISITLAQPTYISTLRHPIRYRLRGFDKDWTESSSPNPTITYTNLPAGTYTLEVENHPFSLTITVLPPWYLTWWMMAVYLVLVILVLIFGVTKFAGYVKRKTREEMNSEYHQDILKATNIVMTHLSDNEFNVDQFAREMGMSRSVLYQHMDKIVGQTTNDFILSVRLRESCNLLREHPEMSIVEVSERVGFSSASYFIKCFHRTYGKTPVQWRKGR